MGRDLQNIEKKTTYRDVEGSIVNVSIQIKDQGKQGFKELGNLVSIDKDCKDNIDSNEIVKGTV